MRRLLTNYVLLFDDVDVVDVAGLQRVNTGSAQILSLGKKLACFFAPGGSRRPHLVYTLQRGEFC